MLTFEDAVAQLRSAEGAGFDISTGQAGKLVNRGLRRLAQKSRYIREVRGLGLTIADTYAYLLPDDILEVMELRLGSSDRYIACNLAELWDLQNGIGQPIFDDGTPAPGAYAESWMADGTHQLAIYPTPDPDLSINVLAAVIPGDFSGSTPLPYPADLEETIIDYSRAYAYEDIDENPDAAATYMQKADAEAEVLRRRANSRAGSSNVQIIPSR